MRTATLMSVAILVLAVAPVSAANIYFEQAEYVLPQNVTGYQVHVMASGGEVVKGIEMYLEVQANGPTFKAPPLPPLDLTGAGLIFEGGSGPFIARADSDPLRIIYASTDSNDDPPTHPPRVANGTLAVLTFSTVGIERGSYKLAPMVGDNVSFFTGPTGGEIPTNLESTILKVVPEPAAIVQILGLLGALPAVLVYRRWKAAR